VVASKGRYLGKPTGRPRGVARSESRCGETFRGGGICVRRLGHPGHHSSAASRLNSDAATRRMALMRSRRAARIKLELGCVDCGYRLHSEVLQFDHLPGTEKLGEISQMHTSATWERIEAEIMKCVVRCANCHIVKTAERRPDALSQPSGQVQGTLW
jgi:hypothetical protein